MAPESPSVNVNALIQFQDIFSEESPLQPEQYLTGVSRLLVLQVAAELAGHVNTSRSRLHTIESQLHFFFSPGNISFRQNVEGKIRDFSQNFPGRQIQIINTYSSLKLFRYAFQYCDENNSVSDLESEKKVFKAYLILNQKLASTEDVIGTSTEHLDFHLRIPMFLFCQSYIYSDVFNFNLNDLIVTESIKGHLFFDFLNSHPDTQLLLAKFIEYFSCSDWKDYYRRLLPLAFNTGGTFHEGAVQLEVPHDNQYEESIEFINKITITEDTLFSEIDFNVLRSAPIFKISNGIYKYVFPLFVVEKLFKGLYFQLKVIKTIYNINLSDDRLKQLISWEFSEQILLYSIINSIYGNRYIKFTGVQMDEYIDGAIDYYLRIHDKIFLFESKDFLIPARVKETRDFHQYEDEFEIGYILKYCQMAMKSQKQLCS